MVLAGSALLASTALLVSFAQGNDDDKKKKYQIIHHSNGETITHDTVVPMSSSYTPKQFLKDKGISDEDAKIITIPSIPEIDMDGKMMKTFVHEMDFETDGEGSDEMVEITVEMDEDGSMKTKKLLNGVEVELTEEELQEIKTHHGEHGKMIQVHIDDENIKEMDERIEISVEVDDEGNRTVKKMVNGEEVEVTDDELQNIDIEFIELMDGEDLNVFISEELEGEMQDLELKIEKIIEDVVDIDKLAEDEVQFITKRIEINSDGKDINWESIDGDHEVKVIMTGDDEDHTIVLVTENYDESSSTDVNIMKSSEDMDVYPNPNDGTFKIRYKSDDKKKTSISITDASGKQVFQEDLGKFSGSYEKEINLKEFGSGLYTVTIQNGDNKEVKKVMIK
jgi:hypothetical protein